MYPYPYKLSSVERDFVVMMQVDPMTEGIPRTEMLVKMMTATMLIYACGLNRSKCSDIFSIPFMYIYMILYSALYIGNLKENNRSGNGGASTNN